MQKKTRILLGTVLGASIAAGIAIATPTLGVLSNAVLSTGTITQDVFAYADYALETGAAAHFGPKFKVALETSGPANIVQQDVTFSPSGTTGWHQHPGLLLLTLAADSGSVDWYDSSCHKTVYQAGDSWTEGTSLHDVVVNASSPAHFLITYVIAKDVPKRIGELAPPCAAAANLQ